MNVEKNVSWGQIKEVNVEFFNWEFNDEDNNALDVVPTSNGLILDKTTDNLWVIDTTKADYTLIDIITAIQGEYGNPYIVTLIDKYDEGLKLRLIVDFKLDTHSYNEIYK